MSSCQTKRVGGVCSQQLYRCKNCGKVGCAVPNCPSFNFSGDICQTCRKNGRVRV